MIYLERDDPPSSFSQSANMDTHVRKESVAVAEAVASLFSSDKLETSKVYPIVEQAKDSELNLKTSTTPTQNAYTKNLTKFTSEGLDLQGIDLISVGSLKFTTLVPVAEKLHSKITSIFKPVWCKYVLVAAASVMISTIIFIGFYSVQFGPEKNDDQAAENATLNSYAPGFSASYPETKTPVTYPPIPSYLLKSDECDHCCAGQNHFDYLSKNSNLKSILGENVCLLCLPNSPSFTTDSLLEKTQFEFDVLPILMENLDFYKSYNSDDKNELTPGSFLQIMLENQDTDRDPILIMLDEIDVSTYRKHQKHSTSFIQQGNIFIPESMIHLPFNGDNVFRRENTFYKDQEYSDNTKISGYITEKMFDGMGFKRITVDWSGVNLVVEILDLQNNEIEVSHVLTVLDWRETVGFESIDSIGFRTNFFNMAVLNFNTKDVFGCRTSPVTEIKNSEWKLESDENCDLCCSSHRILNHHHRETSNSVVCIGSNDTNIAGISDSYEISIKNSTLEFSAVSVAPETSFPGGQLSIKLTNTNNEKLYSETGSPVASLQSV